jgi:hypothetical protein
MRIQLNQKSVLITASVLLLVLFVRPNPATSADNELITKGLLKGSVTAIPITPSDSLFRIESVATGKLSHVGRVTLTWVVPEAELDMLNQELIVPDPVWRGTLTTPNGDQIFWDYEFPDPVFSFTPQGDLRFLALAEVTGGTGRFENVAGRAMAVGEANIFTGRFRINFLGLGSLSD